MKAGGAVSAGISAGAGRASGGALGSAKSVSVSLSPEAMSRGSASAFSSKGLSRFNSSPISFKEIPSRALHSKSIINIHSGKGEKPAFAVSPVLRAGKRMFDMSRPAVKSNFSNDRISSSPKISIDIENGKGKKSDVARSKSLEPQKVLFDVPKKLTFPAEFKSKIVHEPGKISNSKTPLRPDILKPIELSRPVKPRTEIKPHPIKDTVNFWQNPNRIHAGKIDVKPVTVKKLDVKNNKRITLSQRISILPSVSPDAFKAIRQDIKDAKKMVPLIVRARSVSVHAAQEEMAQVLAKKHEGKIQIFPRPEVRTNAYSATETQPVPEKMAQEKKVKLRANKVLQKDADDNKDKKEFYFDEDENAQRQRVALAVESVEYLLKYKKPEDGLPTGQEVASLMKNPGEEVMSEVSRVLGIDKSFDLFIDKIGRIGEIPSVQTVSSVIQDAIKAFKAVRLSVATKSANKENAEIVYGSGLHEKPASFGKNGEGKFHEDSNSTIWFVPQNNPPAEIK